VLKAIVVVLDGPDPMRLFGDDRQVNLRRLMAAGLYGLLDGDFRDVVDGLPPRSAPIVRLTVPGCEGTDLDTVFDDELGGLLETLTAETVLLIAARSAFVLAGPSVPALGEVDGVEPADLAATVQELCGHDDPDAPRGRSLLSGLPGAALNGSGYTDDEDALVRERLSGLGYIG
jgi:hypothetical protein